MLKKIFKYLITTVIIVITGTSIILNAYYIPRYIRLHKAIANEDNISLQINITNKYSNPFNININYDTSINNLGQLLEKHKETYILTDSSLGHYISGITYNNITIKGNNNYYWQLFYNHTISDVGIDYIKLKNNDIIDLSYTKIDNSKQLFL